MVTLAKRSRFRYRIRAIKSEVERSLRLSEDFNVCLEAIYDAAERFSKCCVPLTISQIISLKALHEKVWRDSGSVVVYEPVVRMVKGRDELG